MQNKTELTPDFRQMNNLTLVQELKRLVQEERQLTLVILKFLEEIEFRRIYSHKYPSLFEFCTRELGYSGSAAQRRIDSMRALKAIPELGPKIESGVLALSVVSKTQAFFRQEKKMGVTYSTEEKTNIFNLMERKSARDCERELAKISPQSARPELLRPLSAELTEIKMTIHSSFLDKIEKVRRLISNKHPHLTNAELLEHTVDIAIDKLTKIKPPNRVIKREKFIAIAKDELSSIQQIDSIEQTPKKLSPGSRYIPASIRHHVWMRDKGLCTHLNCKSSHRIHFDHIVPIAFGGKTEISNLRLLCQTHNLEYARKSFGNFKGGKWSPELHRGVPD